MLGCSLSNDSCPLEIWRYNATVTREATTIPRGRITIRIGEELAHTRAIQCSIISGLGTFVYVDYSILVQMTKIAGLRLAETNADLVENPYYL